MLHENLLDPFFDTVLSENIGDYQGDTLLILKNKDYYSYQPKFVWGFLSSGYGSCSGCDAWEGADTGKEQFELLVEEVKDIKWFESLKLLQDYVSDLYNRELEWYGNEPEYKDFVTSVLALTDAEGETDG